jgi:hypothetical protein
MNDPISLLLAIVVHSCGAPNCTIQDINAHFSTVRVCGFPVQQELSQVITYRGRAYLVTVARECEVV